MKLYEPISTIMSTELITVNKDYDILTVKKLMDENGIHHIPVVHFEKLVGLISKSDLLFFLKGLSADNFEDMYNESRMENFRAEDIMTENLECLNLDDTILKSIELLQKNKYHSIPIIKDDDTLVGIVTTYDIVNILLEENQIR